MQPYPLALPPTTLAQAVPTLTYIPKRVRQQVAHPYNKQVWKIMDRGSTRDYILLSIFWKCISV